MWGVKHTTFERAVYKAIPRRDMLSSSAHATVGAMVRHFWCTRARWLVLPGANARGPRVSYRGEGGKKRKKRKKSRGGEPFLKRGSVHERGDTHSRLPSKINPQCTPCASARCNPEPALLAVQAFSSCERKRKNEKIRWKTANNRLRGHAAFLYPELREQGADRMGETVYTFSGVYISCSLDVF